MARRSILSRRALPAMALVVLTVAALVTAVALAAVPPNLTKAVEAQRRVATERPQDAGVHNDLANLLLLADQPEEAEAAYRRAIELDPRKVSALFNLGLLLQQRGEVREALRLYREVVEVDPRHAWAHYQIGTLYEGWNQDGKAIGWYARAFALDSQLAFREVNPHIVENSLVTEAMLHAYQNDVEMPQAPKVYDEPGRIASLLVPLPQPSETPAPAAADRQAGTPAQPRDSARNRPTTGQTAQPGDRQPGVLNPSDLRPGRATGQAAPQGPNRGRQVPGQAGVPRGLRQWERPEPGQPYPPQGGMSPDGRTQQPGAVVTPPPGGVYYRPGVPSSGRLDLRIVPSGPGRQGDRDARG